MAITPKIKLLRVLSVLQCWIAVWLFVLGIVEQVRVSWNHTGLALAIWISLWVAFTGTFGAFITFKRVQINSQGTSVPSHLVMSLMGFSLTCGILSTLYLFHYSQEISLFTSRELNSYFFTYESGNKKPVLRETHPLSLGERDSENHALVGSIFGFMVVELILSMWSVAICLINDDVKILTEEENVGNPLITSTGQEQSSRIVTGGFRVLACA
ncbi:uncharacterized protein [Acropora muricata]|uniref:uncharacterized protein n=1 Tax=Acropora muricata TaxID=159855 RepID=UPI0034E3F093